MSERWKTISRRDPDFFSYLDGSFSRTERALPFRTLNPSSLSETVTFEVVPLAEIASPGFLVCLWRLMRPSTLVLGLGPMVVTALFCLVHAGFGAVNAIITVFSFVGVLFFQSAMNLFNDYFDHMGGQDRIKQKGGSRVIQNGWVRARDVKSAAWVFLALAAFCALPAIVMHFSPLAVVAGLLVVAGLEFAFYRLGLKYRGFSEIMAFALTGPLLTCGFAWAITGATSIATAALGCVFGAISLMYFHLVNFENIMSDDLAGVRTWATRAGFDASKQFFGFTSALVLMFGLLFVVVFERDARLLPVLAAQLVYLFPLLKRVRAIQSPLSSELTGIRAEALKLSWLTTAVLAAGYLGIWVAGGVG